MYIVYDTEATGLDVDFTQLLQVAMALADDDLNMLSSKKAECRRLPWVIPSPGAMLITGFTPDDLKNGKLSHYSMMRDLAAWVNSQHWPVTFLGYNSRQFDDPAFERNLAQNLLPQNVLAALSPHNNGRNRCLDIFPLVKQVALYYPSLLKLDILNEYGKPSLTLLNVAQQNGVPLAADEAHDAMNDLRATIGVARLIMQGAPDLWTHALENMTSGAKASAYMASTPVFTYTDIHYGGRTTMAATDVAGSVDGNRRVIFDLSHDFAAYRDLPVAELTKLLRRNFERGQNGNLPFKMVWVDEQPAINPIDLCKHAVPGYDATLAAARAAEVAGDADFRRKMAEALALVHRPRRDFNQHGRPPMLEELFRQPVAAAVQPKLDKWIQDFHAADWPKKAVMARGFATEFADAIAADPHLKRFGKYAGRIVFDNAPQTLNADERGQMMTYIARRALDTNINVEWNTLAKSRRELEKIESERAEGKAKWAHVQDTDIRAIKLYYTALEKELAPYLPPTAANANVTDIPQATPKPPKFG